jgi:hypothetical protein
VLRFLLGGGLLHQTSALQHEVRRDAVTNDKPPIRQTAAATPAAKFSIEDAAVALVRLARLHNKSASGFDPYAGASTLKPPARKKVLRKLGEWIDAKRKAAEIKRQEAALARPATTGSSKNAWIPRFNRRHERARLCGSSAVTVRNRSVRTNIGSHRHIGGRNAMKTLKTPTQRLADNSAGSTAPK